MKAARDLQPVRPFHHVGHRGHREDQRDQRVRPRHPVAAAVGRQRHRERRGGDQHQDPGRVRARLGIHVGVEDPGDQEGDGREHQHQRADGQRPRRGHPVPGAGSGDQVEQAMADAPANHKIAIVLMS
jgi:hypothetical protein